MSACNGEYCSYSQECQKICQKEECKEEEVQEEEEEEDG